MCAATRSEIMLRKRKRRRARRRRRLLVFVCMAVMAAIFFTGHELSRRARLAEDGVELFLQTDSRWKDVPYGSSTMGVSGCAPTCLAMVATAVTGNDKFTPEYVAKFSEENGYYIEGTGTSWELMSDGARKLGLRVNELALDKNLIMRELEKHHPIICSVLPGDFTTEGHFIVLSSCNGDIIYVKDPNSMSNSLKEWSYERLSTQIAAMWVYKSIL